MQRHAIVLIEWGPQRWQKAVIAPGETLRVGRLERADLVVSHDDRLSGLHFQLAWDGARCAMRDLRSYGGTELNGERAESGEVGHGEWIRAGRTVFSIYHEGVVPPWAPERGGRAGRRSSRRGHLDADVAGTTAIVLPPQVAGFAPLPSRATVARHVGLAVDDRVTPPRAAKGPEAPPTLGGGRVRQDPPRRGRARGAARDERVRGVE